MIEVNNFPVAVTRFPDKTSQVWKLDKQVFDRVETHEIYWKFESEAEIFHVIQLAELLRAESAQQRIELTLPYLPYGRQDKRIGNEKTFALRTFAKLINAVGFSAVHTVDVQSTVATELINGLENTVSQRR